MKVKEVIRELEKYGEEREVILYVEDNDGWLLERNIKEIFLCDDDGKVYISGLYLRGVKGGKK